MSRIMTVQNRDGGETERLLDGVVIWIVNDRSPGIYVEVRRYDQLPLSNLVRGTFFVLKDCLVN